MIRVGKISVAIALIVLVGGLFWLIYSIWIKPTSILVVNPLPAQEAEIILNNDSRNIKVTCVSMEEAKDFESYDAVLMYGRGLYLDSIQLRSLDRAAGKGVPVFTNTLRNFSFVVNHNLNSLQTEKLQLYFSNPCRENYRNMLRY
ncbi:MAG: cobaltochelatase subunit CobN, partial [Muribaculaceae bacterium]|nr:cobaltochelatase subunit CobN [Muribaculaceae bacterium]